MNFYESDTSSAAESKFQAQQIAFGPIVFQAAVALRDLGILAALEKRGQEGATAGDIAEELGLPVYGVKVLAEAGLGIGMLLWNEPKRRFSITKTGRFVLRDAMTRANMDFVRDVNYRGLAHLREAVVTGKPAGLKVLGDWPTVYAGLASLDPEVRRSWLAFDHFYSDGAFSKALPLVFREKPRRLLDVGGNTGRWTQRCLAHDPHVAITIADLPGQVRMAERTLAEAGVRERVAFHAIDLLDPQSPLPRGHDAIWMSQFLDCFSLPQIVSILERARDAMGPEDNLFILEAYWDRQEHAAAAFCLQQTSLYFTCIANGNSQMYHSHDVRSCIAQAGLTIVEDVDRIGISHTLFRCRRSG
jgi:hypothetical protein